MASIVLRKFGGMAPSANAKAVPEETATHAQNINLRFGDFRPMPAASTITAATAGSTLYRFEGDASFITKTGEVSFVQGPIPTDTTERTYFTGDGAPKVTNLSGEVRQLGVPAPSVAPTITVTTVDEFTVEDEDAWMRTSVAQAQNIVMTRAGRNYDGAAVVSPLVATANAWQFDFVAPASGTVAADGTLIGTFDNETSRVITDTRLGYHIESTATAGRVEVRVPLFLKGRTFSFSATILNDLAEIIDPTTNLPLLDADHRQQLVDALNDHFSEANAHYAQRIAQVADLRDEFIRLSTTNDYVSNSVVSEVTAFYERSGVTTAIANAKSEAAQHIVSLVSQYNTAPTPFF